MYMVTGIRPFFPVSFAEVSAFCFPVQPVNKSSAHASASSR